MASLKPYVAWVLFVFGVLNLASLSLSYATGSQSAPPTLFDAALNPTPSNIGGAIFSFALIALFGLFHLWWKWK